MDQITPGMTYGLTALTVAVPITGSYGREGLS